MSSFALKYPFFVLMMCLFVIVVGGFVGQWAAVNRFITNLDTNYWFGHQG